MEYNLPVIMATGKCSGIYENWKKRGKFSGLTFFYKNQERRVGTGFMLRYDPLRKELNRGYIYKFKKKFIGRKFIFTYKYISKKGELICPMFRKWLN